LVKVSAGLVIRGFGDKDIEVKLGLGKEDIIGIIGKEN
jgi:hypothetical protein